MDFGCFGQFEHEYAFACFTFPVGRRRAIDKVERTRRHRADRGKVRMFQNAPACCERQQIGRPGFLGYCWSRHCRNGKNGKQGFAAE